MDDSEMAVRRRGRPRAFDEGTVRKALMHAFWRDGYARTSMARLVDATGLSTSSLYQGFGSKVDLFRVAFDRYVEVIGGQSWRMLADGDAGLADLETYFDVLATVLDQDPRAGCLAVNALLELRDPPPAIAEMIALYRRELDEGIHAVLRRAARLGEIPDDEVEPLATTLVPLVVAYLTIAGSGAPDQDARAVLSAARRMAHL